MNRVEKMFHAIEKKTDNIPDGYGMYAEEWFALFNAFRDEPLEAINAAFKYGFSKGENYATNKAKKARREEAKES